MPQRTNTCVGCIGHQQGGIFINLAITVVVFSIAVLCVFIAKVISTNGPLPKIADAIACIVNHIGFKKQIGLISIHPRHTFAIRRPLAQQKCFRSTTCIGVARPGKTDRVWHRKRGIGSIIVGHPITKRQCTYLTHGIGQLIDPGDHHISIGPGA